MQRRIEELKKKKHDECIYFDRLATWLTLLYCFPLKDFNTKLQKSWDWNERMIWFDRLLYLVSENIDCFCRRFGLRARIDYQNQQVTNRVFELLEAAHYKSNHQDFVSLPSVYIIANPVEVRCKYFVI